MTKTCAKCRRAKPLAEFYKGKGVCKKCDNARRSAAWAALTPEQRHEEYLKEKRRPSKQRTAFDKQRRRAARLSHKAIKEGQITKATRCEVCGCKGKPLDLHHPRYDEPETVVQCCRSCHTRTHRQQQKIMLYGKDNAA